MFFLRLSFIFTEYIIIKILQQELLETQKLGKDKKGTEKKKDNWLWVFSNLSLMENLTRMS